MDATDHLKWMIGDMAFQLANLNAKVEELELKLAQAPQIVSIPIKEEK